jgi:hypothetical protein
LQAIWEATYDLYISLNYGLGVELEDDPRSRFRQQVGSDTYGAGVKYLYKIYSYRMMVETGKSNTASYHYSVKFGVGIDF